MPGCPPRPTIDRLLGRVEKTEGCWLWTGALKGNGYGTIGISIPQRGNAYVHRVMYEYAHGPIPAGMEVGHRCDVRRCVRPEHLFLVSHQGNVADMMAKGRQSRGEGRWSARLTEGQVREIRRRVAAGERRRVLAEEHAVSLAAVDLIVTRRRWKHID